ncbi:hypothetical protein M527_15140 [Sphingobium indicum IP26]|nr:hypothetical protein M527_15140 [Sphingobium indicum IP26]
MHVDLSGAERGGDLETNKACTDNDSALRCLCSLDEIAAVGKRAQVMYMRERGAGYIEVHGLGPGSKKQGVIGKAAAVCQNHLLCYQIERDHRRVQAHIDFMLLVEFNRAEGDPILWGRAGQIVLGKIWPVARQGIVGTQQCDATSIAFPAKRFCCGVACRAAADNDNRCRHRIAVGEYRSNRLIQLFANINDPARLLHAPPCQRISRWGADHVARAQVETGMMPGTSDCLIYKEPSGKGGAIMCAKRADCKQPIGTSNQQNGFTARMALQHRSFRQRREWNAKAKVRPG